MSRIGLHREVQVNYPELTSRWTLFVLNISDTEISPKQQKIDRHALPKDVDYVLLWYGANARSRSPGEVPRIYVWFRPIDQNGTLGKWLSLRVPMNLLGQMRIGSIWRNGISSRQLKFTELHFKGSFDANHWSDTTSHKDYGPALIPEHNYYLPYGRHDHSRLLRFKNQNRTLLVPCMEFFTRCYARNDELNRILITYERGEVQERLMLREPVESSSPNRSIWIPWPISKADAHLLAQLRYDEEIARKIAGLRAFLDKEFKARNQSITFLDIGPWHYGPAQLKVEGVQLDSGDFLGLRITGHSLPEKPQIHAFYIQRESRNSECLSPYPLPHREIIDIPEDEAIQVDMERSADRDTDIYRTKDPAMEILGNPATVYPVAMKKESGKTVRIPSQPSDTGAPGETEGTGKGIGQLRNESDAVLPSEGAILDLWNGLIYLKEANPNIINSVEWYNQNGEFSKSSPPGSRVSLPELDENASEIERDATYSWINKNVLPNPRSVFIFKIETQNLQGYIFEVQRAKRKDDKGITKEESFRGLVAIPATGSDLTKWLGAVIYAISAECGMMKKVIRRILPISLHTEHYKRTKRGIDSEAGHATAFNALEKLGIEGLAYLKPNKETQT
ncbi:hypothetical protein [Delftia sp. JD2]|uniref:hypothetical protein n=1 Tax=Delftia sp. JD2 TaxID=469553 RepID=UPI001112C149|nr:hypothetical protein [Delftia sp. JD2]